METNKNIGLIECSSKEVLSRITSQNNPDGYIVKKIMATNKIAGDSALVQYPGAQLVEDINSIINDAEIDLILVSGSKQKDINIIGEAVNAGKNVRII